MHRGEEHHLLARELSPHTRLWGLETLQSRDPVVPEPPRVPAVGREGRREEKVEGAGLGQEGCVIVKRALSAQRKEEGGWPCSRRQVHS